MGWIPDDTDHYDARVQSLADEYAEMKHYVEHEKPYWLYLDACRDREMRWVLFNYFPAAHYQLALRELEPETDGGHESLHNGRQQSTVYYWLDPKTGAALYHTGVYTDEANPFFGTVEEAEASLEQQADAAENAERYAGMSLYRAGTRKIEDATAVLTEQTGIGDFMPDGGLQIRNPQHERVYFWYDPTSDYVL